MQTMYAAMIRSFCRTLPVVLLLAGLLSVAACDSGDPIDEPDPAEVAGTYQFTEFSFDPEAPILPTFNLLADTLVASATRLELFDGGAYVLTYQLEGGTRQPLSGNFRLTDDEVRLRGDEDDEDAYENMLLPRSFNLERSGENVLTADLNRTVDLADYSDRYSGIGDDIDGTLHMRLTLVPPTTTSAVTAP